MCFHSFSKLVLLVFTLLKAVQESYYIRQAFEARPTNAVKDWVIASVCIKLFGMVLAAVKTTTRRHDPNFPLFIYIFFFSSATLTLHQ